MSAQIYLYIRVKIQCYRDGYIISVPEHSPLVMLKALSTLEGDNRWYSHYHLEVGPFLLIYFCNRFKIPCQDDQMWAELLFLLLGPVVLYIHFGMRFGFTATMGLRQILLVWDLQYRCIYVQTCVRRFFFLNLIHCITFELWPAGIEGQLKGLWDKRAATVSVLWNML